MRLFDVKPKQPEVSGVKFSLREIQRIFPIKLRMFSFGKFLNYQVLGIQKGDFFN